MSVSVFQSARDILVSDCPVRSTISTLLVVTNLTPGVSIPIFQALSPKLEKHWVCVFAEIFISSRTWTVTIHQIFH